MEEFEERAGIEELRRGVNRIKTHCVNFLKNKREGNKTTMIIINLGVRVSQ